MSLPRVALSSAFAILLNLFSSAYNADALVMSGEALPLEAACTVVVVFPDGRKESVDLPEGTFLARRSLLRTFVHDHLEGEKASGQELAVPCAFED